MTTPVFRSTCPHGEVAEPPDCCLGEFPDLGEFRREATELDRLRDVNAELQIRVLELESALAEAVGERDKARAERDTWKAAVSL